MMRILAYIVGIYTRGNCTKIFSVNCLEHALKFWFQILGSFFPKSLELKNLDFNLAILRFDCIFFLLLRV